MSFGLIHSDFLSLKQRLTVAIGPDALADINIAPPKGNNDELSFIRLVAWSYVLLHESGKVSLNFLRRLPPWNGAAMLPYVRALRTWTSHNLLFDRDHDMQTIKLAVSWFSTTCGVGTPREPRHWESCFTALCNDLHDLLSKAIASCDNFDTPDDGPALVKDLQERLDRAWEGHRFDRYAEAAMQRLQYTGYDVVAFRNRYLEQWRRIVTTSVDDQIERNLALRIEADLLAEFGNALPVTSDEMTELMTFETPQALVSALFLLRNQTVETNSSVLELLRAVRVKKMENSTS
jgi:hypothetical protein